VSPLVRAGLLLVVVAAAVAAYQWWYSAERQIRRVLVSVEEGFTHAAPTSGLGAVSAAAALQPYFSENVVIDPGRPFGAVQGREAVLAAAARLRSSTPAFRVEFVDVQIGLAPDNLSASIDCTAMATLQDRAGQESVDAREVIITMHVQDGRWVITHARAVEVLEPVTP
jgi:SnoaL-like domain